MNKLSGLNFISIGGCFEIGMNLYAYIYDDKWILVDMGMGFDNTLGRELIVPSPEILIENKSKIQALFITHSHEDHIGAIPYLWPMIECPIYTRSFTIEMIKAKLSSFDLDRQVPLIKAGLNQPIKLEQFSVEFISVAHSTPESSALAIHTPAGTVIHTGDWRIDREPVLGLQTDEKRLKELGNEGVLALVSDSTNAYKEEQYGTEKEVRQNLIDLVQNYKNKRILVTCFASNVARIESCYEAAKASGRKLVVIGRSLKRIEKVAKAAGYFQDIPAFLDDRSLKDLDPSEVLMICTGSQGEMSSALTKIANDAYKGITLGKDDVVIFSSRTIPGNEKAVLGIQNLLTEKGGQIITDLEYAIHASGHPTQPELMHLYELVRPKVLIPIHGERIHLYKQAELAEKAKIETVLVPSDGDVININKSGAKVIDQYPVNMLAVDGVCLIPVDGDVYKAREKLSASGVVSLCVRLLKNSVKFEDIEFVGIFERDEQDAILEAKHDIETEIKLSLENILKGKTLDKTKARDLIKKIVKTILLKQRGKKPLVVVHIVE